MVKKNYFATDQENFWAGDFGNEYIGRNKGEEILASNLVLFSKALAQAGKIGSCIEFGANIGMNLKALKLLFPKIKLNGIELQIKGLNQVGVESCLSCTEECLKK